MNLNQKLGNQSERVSESSDNDRPPPRVGKTEKSIEIYYVRARLSIRVSRGRRNKSCPIRRHSRHESVHFQTQLNAIRNERIEK